MAAPDASVLPTGAPQPDVAGPGPGAQPMPAPPVPAVAPQPPMVGMPQMPGVPPPVGPKGPNFDPTGTVPVAGSPADPAHPAQQQAAAPPPVLPPATAEEAAARRYTADQKVADIDQKSADNAAETAKTDEAEAGKKAELLKAQAAETAADDARQQAGLAKATAERDQLRKDTADFKFHNFWDTRSTGQKLLADVGIILGSASRDPNHVNQAARDIDTAVSQEWDAQKADLARKFQLAQVKGEDVKELASQYAIDSGKLKLRQEQQLNALAGEIDFLSSKSKNQAGILAAQKVAAEARALAEQHGQQGVKDIAEAHSSALKDEETKAQTALALAKAGKTKRGGAGGGNGDALAAFIDAAGALKPGEPIPGKVGMLAAKAGFKAKDIAAAVDKYRNSGATAQTDANKAAGLGGKGGKGGGDMKDAVIIDNQPIGLAPSGRGGAAAFGARVINYRDAIKSLEDLKTYVQANPVAGRLPAGDAYNRAVLAVAATTTANASDKTTTHEANTIKNWGVVSTSAIQKTLDHIKERQKEFMGTLRPLPGAPGAGGFQNAPAAAGPAEGTRSINAKGVKVIFQNGKWGPDTGG